MKHFTLNTYNKLIDLYLADGQTEPLFQLNDPSMLELKAAGLVDNDGVYWDVTQYGKLFMLYFQTKIFAMENEIISPGY